MAVGMWRLLLAGDHAWPLLDDWCDFLTKHHSNRAISKDTWQQLYDFIKVRGVFASGMGSGCSHVEVAVALRIPAGRS